MSFLVVLTNHRLRCLVASMGLVLSLSLPHVSAWILSADPYVVTRGSSRSSIKTNNGFGLRMNLLSDIGDMLTGGKLAPQQELAHGEPLGPLDSDSVKTLAIQERPISFTGEDFDVYDITSDQPFCSVKGAMLHLPGKDKMIIRMTSGKRVAMLDRKLVAMTPTYDILREDGQKLGWIAKAPVALTDTFEVFVEGDGGFGPFNPPPAYKIEGDFIDRTFVMKNTKNEVVAKVTKDYLIEFDAFNHYQVQVAPGMDSVLVVACACAIDEEFDEEHKEKKERELRD